MADSPFALRLSHAAHWVKCSAFPEMNRRPEAALLEGEADHTVREEGTAIHWVAATLKEQIYTPTVGEVAPNGVIITDELMDAALFYLNVLDSMPVSEGWYIEAQNMPARRIHSQCGGTPDAFGLYRAAPTIRVPDLKGGFVPVEVFPNWQLFGYLAAILDQFPEWEVPGVTVEFCIVQPRAFHKDGPVRKFSMPLLECYPYFETLRMAAHIAMGDYAKAIAGPQCDDCNARHACAVAHKASMRALEISGEPDMLDLTAAAVDYEMLRLEDAQRMLTARLTGLRAQATHMIRNGQSLPHWAMESGNGRLKWIDDEAERAAIAMGDLLGKNLRKRETAITPTQASKLMPADMLDTYARRERGEVKLVRFDSNVAVKAFSNLKKV
jgi:hypothetical protein